MKKFLFPAFLALAAFFITPFADAQEAKDREKSFNPYEFLKAHTSGANQAVLEHSLKSCTDKSSSHVGSEDYSIRSFQLLVPTPISELDREFNGKPISLTSAACLIHDAMNGKDSTLLAKSGTLFSVQEEKCGGEHLILDAYWSSQTNSWAFSFTNFESFKTGNHMSVPVLSAGIKIYYAD